MHVMERYTFCTTIEARCKVLHPDGIRQKSEIFYTNALPMNLWRRIHYLRDIDDFNLTNREYKDILGFTKRKDPKHNNLKNALVRYLLWDKPYGRPYFNNMDDLMKGLGDKFINDRHILFAGLHNEIWWDWGFPTVQIDDIELAHELVAHHWKAYSKLPSALAKNCSLARIAIQQHVINYNYLPPELQQDFEFALYAITRMDKVYPRLNDNLKENKTFIAHALKRNAGDIKHVPVHMRNTEEIALMLVNNPVGVLYLNPQFFNTKIIGKMLENDIGTYFLLSYEVRNLPEIHAIYQKELTKSTVNRVLSPLYSILYGI